MERLCNQSGTIRRTLAAWDDDNGNLGMLDEVVPHAAEQEFGKAAAAAISDDD